MALGVVSGLGAVAGPALADPGKGVHVAKSGSSTMKRGLIRRDEAGNLVLDTSPAAMRIARHQRTERAVRQTTSCVRGGPLDASARAPRWVRKLVEKIAPKYRLDPDLVVAVVAVESNFEPKAVSPKNAQGLMQLIPQTARRFGVRDPFNPTDNLHGGMKYLQWLLDHFGGNLALALAGYNAGEEAVHKHGGVPPYPETERYVQAVQSIYGCVPPPVRVAEIHVGETQASVGLGLERSAWPPVRPAYDLWAASARRR